MIFGKVPVKTAVKAISGSNYTATFVAYQTVFKLGALVQLQMPIPHDLLWWNLLCSTPKAGQSSSHPFKLQPCSQPSATSQEEATKTGTLETFTGTMYMYLLGRMTRTLPLSITMCQGSLWRMLTWICTSGSQISQHWPLSSTR